MPQHVLYNGTADKCETKTGQYIQINKCSLRGWLKVKKRGVLSRRFIAPIRNYAWIRCFFCVQSKQLKLCAVVKKKKKKKKKTAVVGTRGTSAPWGNPSWKLNNKSYTVNLDHKTPRWYIRRVDLKTILFFHLETHTINGNCDYVKD